MRLNPEMGGLAEEGLFRSGILVLLGQSKAQLKRRDQSPLTGMQRIRLHEGRKRKGFQVSVQQRAPARSRQRLNKQNID